MKVQGAFPANHPQKRSFFGHYVNIEPFISHMHCPSLYDNLISTPQAWDCMFESQPNSKLEYVSYWKHE